MRARSLVVAGMVLSASTAGLLLVLDASAAAAATASGCRAQASSFDASGDRLDQLALPGPGGTPEDPFRVDPSGFVRWRVTIDEPGDGGTWAVTTPGIVDLGFDGENGSEAAQRGTEPMQPHLTRKLPGIGRVRYASGTTRVVVVVRGERGRAQCTLRAYVKIEGTPIRTPLFWVGVILGLIGGALVVAATPRRGRGFTRTHPLLGLLGGALVGVATAVALVSFGVVVYGTAMPLVVLGAITGAGAMWGSFGAGPRRRRATEPDFWSGPAPVPVIAPPDDAWVAEPPRADETLPRSPKPVPPPPAPVEEHPDEGQTARVAPTEVVAVAEPDTPPGPVPIRWQADAADESR